MELRQLTYFCAVADEANLTRAAERLRLSSPSLSQQIKALEREAGAALFRRTPAGMVLTRAGEALLPEARAVLGAAGRALAVVRAVARERRPVGVTVAPGTPAGVLRGVASAVREAGGEPEFDVVATGGQLVRLRSGRADLAVVTLPVDGEGLRTTVVYDEPLGVLMAADHPLAGRAAVGWADLDGETLLWFRRELAPGYHDMVLDACRAGGWEPPIRPVAARRGIVAAELTSGDRVVALRPEPAPEAGLVLRPLAHGAPRLRLALAVAPGRPGTGVAAAAYEAMANAPEGNARGRRGGGAGELPPCSSSS
ncbi:LysR family transcriptional regulator [Streptomyces caatingaensis]|uniref:LysR substrate-binding domain-containing protein n=1 Tax=Streptomyces caatingaensis TaxID=1678637 RepID=UPI00067285B9|nr:LysR family transcriptional regulator [Streptomyces caatingaensis]